MIQYRVFVIYFFLMMLIQDRTYTYDNTLPSHMYTQGTTEKNEEDHVTEKLTLNRNQPQVLMTENTNITCALYTIKPKCNLKLYLNSTVCLPFPAGRTSMTLNSERYIVVLANAYNSNV